MLEDFMEKMWYRRPHAGDTETGRTLKKAQEAAADGLDDFRFSFNIALIADDVERNPVNAGNILHYFEKEAAPAFKKLDERLQCACRLDWYTCVLRMLEQIAGMPKELRKKKTAEFAFRLDMQDLWPRDLTRYRELEEKAPEEEKLPDFDAYLERMDAELAQPVITRWKKAAAYAQFRKTVHRVVGTAVAVVLVLAIWQIYSGTGFLARALGIHRPRLVSEEAITKDFGSLLTDEVPLKINDDGTEDFNASTILETDAGTFSDRNMRDGDTTTAWAEGEKNDGTGKRLYFNVEGTQFVHYIVIWNGWQKDDDAFTQYNRLKNVTLRIDDGTSKVNTSVTLKSTEGPQYILINQNVDRFWIIMNTVYRGEASDNVTCVSEVKIY